MTWSIIACDVSGLVGVAVASRFFAVGALCAHGRGGVGAISTQALVNPRYAAPALDALARGEDPRVIVTELTASDPGRAHRQVHLIDTRGRSARYTGAACIDLCGDLEGDGFSVAGNMLAGPDVIDATAAMYAQSAHLPFAERLLAALEAGEATGGDKRGKQAAALRIFATDEYPVLDLRVDDHPEPLDELRRLYAKSLERFQPFVACLPKASDPAGITDRAVIEARIEAFNAARSKPE